VHLDTELRIKPTDRVLDIGPGSLPFERADVLVERWPGDKGMRQRGGAEFRTNGKPLVIADGFALPFADDTFDFVMCSHVVEHIDASHIDGFLKELGRVGRRGYIEAPSEVYERMWDVKEHRWFVYVRDGDRLVLRPKTSRNCAPQYFGAFWPLLSKTRGCQNFMHGYKELFSVGYLWSGHPRWEVVGEEEEIIDWKNETVVQELIGRVDKSYQRFEESYLDPRVLQQRGRRWMLKQGLLMSGPGWLRKLFE